MDDHEHRRQDKTQVRIDADLEDIVPGYLANRRKDTDAIRQALEASEYESIRLVGHSMKGSGGGYGFAAITVFGAAFESGAKKRDHELILKTLEELHRYLDGLEVIYEKID